MGETDDFTVDALRETMGIRSELRVWVGGHHHPTRRVVERLVSETVRPPTGPLDAAFICPQTPDEAVYFAGKVYRRLSRGGAIWVLWETASQRTSANDAPPPMELLKLLAIPGLTARESVFATREVIALCFRPACESGE